MSKGDPNQVLMQAAWARLWKPGSSYYLPSVIVNGAQGNGVVVDPLGQLRIADTGALPLYHSDTWGDVSVELTEATVGGLDTLADGGMTYEPASGAFAATVSIGLLTFQGGYAVSAGGAAGCAIDAAAGLLKTVSPRVAASPGAGAGAGDQDNLALAADYRDRLVGSDNGLDLVSTYYDHNETLDHIVSSDTIFQLAWRTHETAGQNTAHYARQTASATANPDDQSATVGDEHYRYHAAYIRTVLYNRVLAHQGQGDPDGRYQALAGAIVAFKGQTEPYKQPMTAAAVMSQVANPSPGVGAPQAHELGSVQAHEPDSVQARGSDSVEARAERQAERDLPLWAERASALEAERAAAAPQAPTPVKGRFEDSVAVASVTIGGAVAVTGTPPNSGLSVTFSSLTADVPPIAIALRGESRLLSEVQTAIANSSWFQQTLAKKLKDELGSTAVLSYLTDRVNQSITQALGTS